MSKDNDTVTITNKEAAWMKDWKDGPFMKGNLALSPDYRTITKEEGDLLFEQLSSRIGNASGNITLAGNTATENISLPQDNITRTEGIYTTTTTINENNDSSTLLGESAVVVEDTTTE